MTKKSKMKLKVRLEKGTKYLNRNHFKGNHKTMERFGDKPLLICKGTARAKRKGRRGRLKEEGEGRGKF